MFCYTSVDFRGKRASTVIMKMLTVLVQLLLVAVAVLTAGVSGRMAGRLPGGFGRLSTNFKCDERPYGYYADVDHGCRAFHVCMPVYTEDGLVRVSPDRASLTPLIAFTVFIMTITNGSRPACNLHARNSNLQVLHSLRKPMIQKK